MAHHAVSLITTVHNEEASIGPLLDAILAQARQPDEFIIVDAGSTDRTREVIADCQSRGLRVRLIVEPGANRSRGRNLAVQAASGDIIACTDAGCIPDPDWLQRLIAPFELDEPPDVVSGYYRPGAHTWTERLIAAATVPAVSEVNPETFLPSSRSVAFARRAWQAVGGYPEYTGYAEDTAFGLSLRAAGFRFRFQPDAVVRWGMRGSLFDLFRQFYRYARSDGQLGHWFPHYTKAFALLPALVVLLALIAFLPSPLPVAPIALLCALAIAYWSRYHRRARSRGAPIGVAAFADDAALIMDLANFVGYLAGWRRRRPRPAPLSADRPLSIAQVTYTYQPTAGGADVYVAQLADLITSAGHHHVVYQRFADTDAPDVRFVPNRWQGWPLEFWTQGLALFRLRRDLLKHDVVICHYPNYLLALHLMALGRPRPLRIAISHGVFWDDSPGALRSRVKAWIARLAFRRAHLYVANDTHFLRAMGLAAAPGRAPRSQLAPRVWFVPNGADTARFQPSPPVPELSALSPILVPRNLFPNRGIHLAIQAFALFLREHPNTTLLIVGGGGQPRYLEQLRHLVEQLGLAERVVFHGPVPHGDLPAIYASAHLTLIPSLCGEGTSLAALESMACSTATICTDVAGLRDLPGPHAPPTPEGLAEVMLRVYPERDRVGEEQRRQVLAEYSLDRWRECWHQALAGVGLALESRPYPS
jgi:glycosyltransferase involved in cell wall biosynthesis